MALALFTTLALAPVGHNATWLPDREVGHMSGFDCSIDELRLDFGPLVYIPQEFTPHRKQALNFNFSDSCNNFNIATWSNTTLTFAFVTLEHNPAIEKYNREQKQTNTSFELPKFNLTPLWTHSDYRFTRRKLPQFHELSRRRIRRAMTTFINNLHDVELQLKTASELHFPPPHSKTFYALSEACAIGLLGLAAFRIFHDIEQHSSIISVIIAWITIANCERGSISVLTLIMLMVPGIFAAKDDDQSSSSGIKCAIFDGVAANFVSWLISFTAWVAWKAPELIPILNGTSVMPGTPLDPDEDDEEPPAKSVAEKRKLRQWEMRNTQLYGAIVSHVAAPIQSSLHVQANGKGTDAILFLKQRYGSQSTGDRAEATARLQKSHIDPRSKLCESDIIKQFNEMSLAAADIVAAGGTMPDDQLLISMFENALPPAYAMIRQMIRYARHTTFDEYYNDFLSQVKAEERASSLNNNPAAFVASKSDKYTFTPRDNRGGNRGKGKDGSTVRNPCFNCGRTDHPRYKCRQGRVTCRFCNANHLDELCPRGPGGPMRDTLSEPARQLLDKQANKPTNGSDDRKGNQAYNAQLGPSGDWLSDQYQAYMSRKRPRSPDQTQSRAKAPDIRANNMHASTNFSAGSTPGHAPRTQPGAHQATDAGSSSCAEIDEFFDSLALRPHAHFAAGSDQAFACAVHARRLHSLAYIDSQATNFVLPSEEYLTTVTDHSPNSIVDTANGPVRPTCIGETIIRLFNDEGKWYTFRVQNAWVLPGCTRVLYSQAVMHKLGIVHRLDEGYILLPDGTRKTISTSTYSIEISFAKEHMRNNAHSASSLAIPMPRNISRNDRGADSRASVPQQLLWQRLGFPSKSVWLHVQDVLIDHGLPDATHLKFDFPMIDAVARARAKVLPFHELRDPDQLPAPGALVYMDFAGPLTPSYPHGFIYYCGTVDAGSGFARVVPAHRPTKEIAIQCLELLLSDMRMLMGLSHKLRPQVVISDQGSQFMSHHFRDFLASEQIRHWPSTVYTPQQNSTVERMWGTRFGVTRTLLIFANLGPAMHPFGMQTANWICNRVSQSSRANMSPWFILARRPASVGYLKSFGCLVRVTIPTARREGDKHFADRGALGIYLGPSEQSPGCVVYIPSTRKFYVTRDVICYEDVHPGIKHVESAWAQLDEPHRIAPTNLLHTTPTLGAPITRELTVSQESVEATVLPHAEVDGKITDNEFLHVGQMNNDQTDSHVVKDDINLGTQPMNQGDAILEGSESLPSDMHLTPAKRTATEPLTDPSVDPKSRLFKRVLPERKSRYQGAYECMSYVDPTIATCDQSADNLAELIGESLNARGDMIVYDSGVSGINGAFVVTTTSQLGKVQIPKGFNHCLRLPEADYWKDAITKEYDGLLAIGTFEFIKRADLPAHANLMRCHLVFTIKRNDDGSIEKFKARLVADGNTQRYGVDFDRVFSTVAKLSTLRILLVIAAARDYSLSSIDIRQAYLQATLNEELYMEMPPGMPDKDSEGNPLVVRLRRSLYGLKQAGREWHNLLTNTLRSWGFQQSSIDVCLFVYSRGASLLLIVVWVDDCVIADNDKDLREEFVQWLSTKFPVEDKRELCWILHVKISRDHSNHILTMSQELYVRDLLDRYAYLLDGLTRRFDSPYDATVTLSSEQSPVVDSVEHACMHRHRDDYMSLVGAYLWLANVSRPELAYIAGQLARFVSNPGMIHYKAALRVLVYLRGTMDQKLKFKPDTKLPLRAFVDANWSTKFSTSGGIIEFMGCAIHWLSRSQRSVSMSSTEAEYFASCLMAREIMYFRALLSDLTYAQNGPTTVLTDNKGVVALSFDPVAFKKTKHILRAAEFVRDLTLRQVITLKWIAGKDNVADLCTKPVTLVVFRALLSLLDRLPDLH